MITTVTTVSAHHLATCVCMLKSVLCLCVLWSSSAAVDYGGRGASGADYRRLRKKAVKMDTAATPKMSPMVGQPTVSGT